ncbi:MAG: type VI secretion system baseplate subunit TssE [Myxococcales bacterium]|nr:type VI secretion system baseplate subunit TssE [Myxococcales bacterium]MCH7868701.1 type VI secretion system baseplate subunit TssE [Myxococcales bacterium]
MAERHNDALRPSILDRLMAGETGAGARAAYEYIGVRELRNSVARDLEWLLNTKFTQSLDLDQFPEAQNSILTYGVPDFSTYSWRNASDAHSIARILGDTIRRFEPRLLPRSIKVEVLPNPDIENFSIAFRIEAILNVDPIRETVSFDVAIDFESTSVYVKGAD